MAASWSPEAETQKLPHIAIFPFLAKGHTIPLIHLAHYLHRYGLATVTFFTTAGNAGFIREGLSGADAAIVELTFPTDVPGIPPGVESAEGLTSLASFVVFADATFLLLPQLDASLAEMQPPASLLVTDPFMHWTKAPAARLGVPKVSFFGISAFAQVMRELTFEDFMAPFGDPASIAPMLELDACWAQGLAHRATLPSPTNISQAQGWIELVPTWMEWLDDKAAAGRAVLYVALGTLAAIPESQLKEVANGLERAEVDFIWAVRPENIDLGLGFEERTKERGLVVREWVDQLEILNHSSVQGFLSHCGWNSILESVTAGVPLAVWPMHADQPFNSRFLVDESRSL
ncbi:unnamed protein product [Miscanthus lutarioriparius]|uniref:UDP-glycosyltransferases domain-containing protein n=1 Tax=Miscanthus lutarioriparius TaxID=422564 RepID=A0A811NEA7_9POAL|nr:unnamed protein product [Miscanthus lutarioriparius]